MNENNTNLENNVNVNPQPVDLNPQPISETPVQPAPVEMPTPVVAPTPVAPVAPVAPVTPVETPAPVAPVTPAPVEAPASVEAPAPVVAPAPVEAPVQPVAEPTVTSPNLESASMSNLAPVVENPTNVSAPQDNNNVEQIAQGIQNGSFVNAVTDPNEMIGAKMGSSADTLGEEKKKKGKKKVVVLIVVLLILAILGGVGYFGYQYEFKSADKRVNALFDKVNSYVNPLLKDFEKKIGDYDIDANLTVGTDKAQIHLSGNYAYNLEDYVYLDTTIDKIYYNEDLIDKTPIKLNVYLNDDKLYLKAEDILAKYIYIDVDGLDEVMNNVKQNEVNYSAIYTSVMNALKVSINKYCLSQTVGKATVDGKSTTANIVTVTINKNNYKSIIGNMLTVLANNNTFVTNVANIAGKSNDEIKKSLTDAKEDLNNDTVEFDGSVIVKVYTKVIGSELLGIDVLTTDDGSSTNLYIVPTGSDSYKVKTTVDGKDVSNLTYGISKTNSAGKTSYVSTVKGDATVKDSEGKDTVYQFDTKFTYNINLQYQDDKPVVRDAVSYENLTEEDYLDIVTNATTKYGLIGTYIAEFLGLDDSMEDTTTDIPLN